MFKIKLNSHRVLLFDLIYFYQQNMAIQTRYATVFSCFLIFVMSKMEDCVSEIGWL